MSPRLRELRRRARPIIAPFVCTLALVYFVYHGVQGERGLLAWVQRGGEVDVARAEVHRLAAERAALERRIRLLSPGSLDLDLLEERARILLNRGHPDDIILFERSVERRRGTPAN